MTSKAKLPGRGRSSLWAFPFLMLAIVATPFGPASGQTPTDLVSRLQSLPPAAQSTPLRRFQYFYEQRAFPNQQTGAYQRALADHVQKFGPMRPQPLQGAPLPASIVNLWTSIGPSQISTTPTTSGRTNTIAVDSTNTSIIYVGPATGGVWKTTNGGTSWTSLTDTQCSLAMGSIAIDPSNHLVVYAGTGEENFSADSYSGCGILKSTDGGATWTQTGASVFAPTGAAGAQIGKIAIHPTTTSTLLVATSFGLYRSTNSGSTYTQVLAGTATDVVIDPVTTSTMYAALGNIFGSVSNGVYISTDTGATWTPLAGGLPTSNVGRIGLAAAASAGGTVYATVQSTATFALLGIWKTTNHGTNWTQLTATNASCDGQCWYDMYVAVDPTNANTVYFGGLSVFKSTDGGSTFTDLGVNNSTHTDQHALTFQPGTASTLYVGNDGGVFKSTDSGSTWTSLNTNLAITQFYNGLSLSPTSANTALGGSQDNHVLLYSGPSTVWAHEPFDNVSGCDGGFTVIDQSTPTTQYAECQWEAGQFYIGPRRSIMGSSFTQVISGINTSDSALFIPPIVASPSNSLTLYFGTSKVYKTTNQGTNWTASGTTLGGNVTMIAEAPSNSTVVYAGANNGLVYKSTDSNASYASFSTGLPARVPTYLLVHPTDANTVFATFSGFGTGHVFKTTNGGTSWTDISGNLPNIPANSIVADPKHPTTVMLVGTDLGVYGTQNGGTTWAPFGTGLPNVPVFGLKYSSISGSVVAATHGRGVWRVNVNATPMATHDFNGDGKSDIVWRDTSGNTAIWLLNGGAVLGSGGFGMVPTAWSLVGQRDFNGDGNADLLWRDTSGNTVMWFMTGTTISSSASLGNISTVWSVIATGDFNGDGFADILWRDTSGNLAMWFMNGASISSSAFVGNKSTTFSVAGSGDYNGDGKTDLLWRDTSGNTEIWLMNGATISSSASLGNVSTVWSVAGTGDFDGDNQSDILWHDTSGNTSIWFMSGTTVSSTGGVGTVSTVWSIVQVGDYNGDGKSDIVWRDTSGNTAIWFMNGAAVSSTASFGIVSTVWSVQSVNAE